MIARVELRLRRDGLRAKMREALRREASRLAGAALDRTERAGVAPISDKTLTSPDLLDSLSRDV